MVLGYFTVHKEGDVQKQVNKSCFRLSLITVCRGGGHHHIALELCLQLLSLVSHPVFLSTDKASGDSVLRTSFRHFPSMTLLSCRFPHFANPVGFRVSNSRAELQSHLEHQDIRAASSQINALFDKKIFQKRYWDGGKTWRDREREGKMKREI